MCCGVNIIVTILSWDFKFQKDSNLQISKNSRAIVKTYILTETQSSYYIHV